MVREYEDLVWFLSQGVAAFERSTTGTMLERLESVAYATRECPTCGGSGLDTRSAASREIDRRLAERKPRRPLDAADRFILSAEQPAIEPPEERYIAANDPQWCRPCRGRGYRRRRLTPDEQRDAAPAAPAGTPGASAREQVPDEVLIRFARVSRRLAAMPGHSAAVLSAAYEDDRSRAGLSADDMAADRITRVMPLTPTGRAIVAAARAAGNDAAYRSGEYLASRPERETRRARAEAVEALAIAEQHWEMAADDDVICRDIRAKSSAKDAMPEFLSMRVLERIGGAERRQIRALFARAGLLGEDGRVRSADVRETMPTLWTRLAEVYRAPALGRKRGSSGRFE